MRLGNKENRRPKKNMKRRKNKRRKRKYQRPLFFDFPTQPHALATHLNPASESLEIFHYRKVAFLTCIVEGSGAIVVLPIDIDRGITEKRFHLVESRRMKSGKNQKEKDREEKEEKNGIKEKEEKNRTKERRRKGRHFFHF